MVANEMAAHYLVFLPMVAQPLLVISVVLWVCSGIAAGTIAVRLVQRKAVRPDSGGR